MSINKDSTKSNEKSSIEQVNITNVKFVNDTSDTSDTNDTSENEDIEKEKENSILVKHPRQCSVCQETFTRACNFIKHCARKTCTPTSKKHVKSKIYVCGCGKRIERLDHFRTHQKKCVANEDMKNYVPAEPTIKNVATIQENLYSFPNIGKISLNEITRPLRSPDGITAIFLLGFNPEDERNHNVIILNKNDTKVYKNNGWYPHTTTQTIRAILAARLSDVGTFINSEYLTDNTKNELIELRKLYMEARPTDQNKQIELLKTPFSKLKEISITTQKYHLGQITLEDYNKEKERLKVLYNEVIGSIKNESTNSNKGSIDDMKNESTDNNTDNEPTDNELTDNETDSDDEKKNSIPSKVIQIEQKTSRPTKHTSDSEDDSDTEPLKNSRTDKTNKTKSKSKSKSKGAPKHIDNSEDEVEDN